MSDINHDPKRAARLKDFFSRPDVESCVNAIVSARGHLRELGFAARQFHHLEVPRESLEQELDKLLREVSTGVDGLQGLIRQSDLDQMDAPSRVTSDKTDHWSLGFEDFRGPRISILRGELEPIRRVTVAPRLPEAVVLYFLTIPRLRDLLKRESHGWGYHYHYLDAKRRRSDTLLTFEQSLRTLRGGKQVRVLTWERHSENSRFPARAARWGDKKRESIYSACVGDSTKRSLTDFKKPGKDANTVWPV